MKKINYLKFFMEDELTWVNTTFIFIFMIAGILNGFGLYELNNSTIYAFSLGTFIFTISEISQSEYGKRIFLSIGMFCIVILPHCDSIINFIEKWMHTDFLTIYSIVLIFFCMVINNIKNNYNKKNKKIDYERQMTMRYANILKKIVEKNNDAFKEIKDNNPKNNYSNIENTIKCNENIIKEIDKLIG